MKLNLGFSLKWELVVYLSLSYKLLCYFLECQLLNHSGVCSRKQRYCKLLIKNYIYRSCTGVIHHSALFHYCVSDRPYSVNKLIVSYKDIT